MTVRETGVTAPSMLGVKGFNGGAGTGKSHVIDVLSQKLQKTFQKEGDNPDQPYIIKTAFTGCAAKIIKGQTLHSIFKFQFNDKIMSLSDKERDKMRLGLQNLKVMIIDEISLVKAEMLYQLHFRLSKEIFQNKLPFGGISVIVFGDIMQIKPVLGSFVFGQVKNQNMQLIQSIDNLWEKFEVVALKTNHRQGKDKDYADLLNRVRIGQHTDEDMDFLKTRVFRTEEAPDNALIVSGTNAKVDKYNTNKLNKQVGKLVSLNAAVYSDSKGLFKPPLKYGVIKGTTLHYEVNFKVGSRVMLTTNLDTCDGLVNGSLGEIIGFEYKSNGEIKYVMIQFDDPDDGKNRRKNLQYLNLEKNYPGATPIEKVEVNFSLSKDKGSASSGATAINFPICLCYAVTAHKIQGGNVKKPKSLVLDLDGWLQPAMVYVMLSRIQCSDQLYILEKLPKQNQIKPFDLACRELDRLNSLDITAKEEKNYDMKIVSLNVHSLRKHIEDITSNQNLATSDILCFQETWLYQNEESNEIFKISDKQSKFVSVEGKRGIVTYFDSTIFEEGEEIKEEKYQISAVKSPELMVINVYRLDDAKDDSFIKDFKKILNSRESQNTIIVCGDFNFCEREDHSHKVKQMLDKEKFKSLLNQPTSSHNKGRCLDQAYIWESKTNTLQCNAVVGVSSFSDHDPVIITSYY